MESNQLVQRGSSNLIINFIAGTYETITHPFG